MQLNRIPAADVERRHGCALSCTVKTFGFHFCCEKDPKLDTHKQTESLVDWIWCMKSCGKDCRQWWTNGSFSRFRIALGLVWQNPSGKNWCYWASRSSPILINPLSFHYRMPVAPSSERQFTRAQVSWTESCWNRIPKARRFLLSNIFIRKHRISEHGWETYWSKWLLFWSTNLCLSWVVRLWTTLSFRRLSSLKTQVRNWFKSMEFA